ncbi:MAG: Gfo/Idh/MocA family oxidoreductase [Deltaproteobacteria bacterium]|jgi:predicted dehydrogenase|nr:Gfo/Idh/MocA family oxidoreductase [Deltaproteobacteria bacterium]
MEKIRWGIISTANIGAEKVIPAMQKGEYCDIQAVASASLAKAEALAEQLNIPKAFGSYEVLLDDPDIDAVYIPLPNHLHVPWSIKALEAGKHVLCEKPLALTTVEAQELLDVSKKYPTLKIMEGFMYRHHPQWQKARELVVDGEIGRLQTIQSFFSYYNTDPSNVRNIVDIGGGGLMDIGCYSISLSRFIFEDEPKNICGLIEYDPQLKIDRIASGILEFDRGTSTFTCSTQMAPYQRVNIYGTEGRIEIEIPFNAPPDLPCKMWHQKLDQIKEISFPICDQYTIQGDLFSKAILDDVDVPTPLEDGVANMKVIEALIESNKTGSWVKPA